MADTMKMLVDRVLSALYTREPALKVVFSATGGGAMAAPLLFRAGSSCTMLQFNVPYARASLLRFIEHSSSTSDATQSLPKFVSQKMAERMAESAWKQAQQILWDQAQEDNVTTASAVDATLTRFRSAVGVGCTASLATNYDRRGVNQAFISLCRVTPNALGYDHRQWETFHVHLDKSLQRSREEEDRLVSLLTVYVLATSANVDQDGCKSLLKALQAELHGPDDRFEPLSPSQHDVPMDTSVLHVLHSEKLSSVAFLPSQEHETTTVIDLPFKGLVLPGSFNPLHKGHVDLALAAQELIRTSRGDTLPIAFEIAMANADKGSIATKIIEERVHQFSIDATPTLGKWPVLVSNAMLFSQKAELFRDCVFVIGADTAVRLVDKKYYEMDDHKMILALQKIADLGCSFVVAGRFDEKDTKRFISAEEVCSQHIPPVVKSLFVALREEDFRNDVSSTQLRKAREQTSA